MPRATNSRGALQVLENCYIQTPDGRIDLRILPELTDSKSVNYSNEPIIGRASPIVTFAYSEPRTISSDITFMILEEDDAERNLNYLRTLQSLAYPAEVTTDLEMQAPYLPPYPVLFKCGSLLGDEGVCCLLKSYSVKYPTEVAWHEETMLPYKFTVSCSWEVVYSCSDLPCNNRIILSGR